MLDRGEGKPGRGHCAQCFTPTMCANPQCGCHVPSGARCRASACGVGLYVTVSAELLIRQGEIRAQQALLADYGYTRGGVR